MQTAAAGVQKKTAAAAAPAAVAAVGAAAVLQEVARFASMGGHGSASPA